MIFLFRFDVANDGINFILNEEIARDMYPYTREVLRQLADSTCKVLEHYKIYSKSNPIMQGQILGNGQFEVNLSPGLGEYIDPYTKSKILFENVKLISDMLIQVMNRRTLDN
ncbi:hypothetical protein AM501_03485 [Aneurinibacillus migulanus]|nr:hypothetical protein TS64_12400 [Aneurinibacillus migulanus]KPD09586.1 hypothetical protein AM501_03485 [Aneurinibacillus migulanus]